MSYALVFAGQGTLHAGMLGWLDDRRPALQLMTSALGIEDWRTAATDTDWAMRNANAQPLVVGLSVAAWTEIAPGLPPPVAIAGYSVGELAACVAAGVMRAEQALALAALRASAMDRCAVRAPGGMTALSGLPRAQVEALCAGQGLALAIVNGPVNFIVAGPVAALGAAESEAAALGAERITRLQVTVPSHTPWMAEAAQAMARALAAETLHAPAVPLYTNTAGRVHDAAGAATALAAQIATTVHWNACLEGLASHRPDCVLEVGPGQALARRWNARHPEVPARSCDEFGSAAAVRRWVEAAGRR